MLIVSDLLTPRKPAPVRVRAVWLLGKNPVLAQGLSHVTSLIYFVVQIVNQLVECLGHVCHVLAPDVAPVFRCKVKKVH